MIEEEYGDEYGWLGDDCGGWGWLMMFFNAGGCLWWLWMVAAAVFIVPCHETKLLTASSHFNKT